ncbi:hypothetical protein Q2295_13695 [Leptospira interrogans]|uniref:Lipoprotein n=11 Tax=Leptospira interrogans TaxID=173 RepID=A0AA40WD03_LEPIR|nr:MULTISPECIES: hypothetical protein [Leptospira]EMG20791.1 hypothetical protein LEP1GSC150_4548 [Leptospira interrogans serovar Copenhageni str. LT2050]AAS69000.1 putative lipoprotein [Leptospira interrogans serovar Copenhageni str. Fiocruz L1-130]KGE28156.1 hypothetical protein IQ65_02380 [Leptospira interrogans serovar Lai]MBE8344840.1 hypothetical protein [Leptospira interrogans serovar Pomona]MBE8354789.1 hypothetical protein [Leptospira interrogans serovar Pomona]
MKQLEDPIMIQKKIVMLVFLIVLFSNCHKSENKQDNNLLLLQALAVQDPGIAGLLAPMDLMRSMGGSSGAGAYSKGIVSPFQTTSTTEEVSTVCPLGGKVLHTGEWNESDSQTGASLQYSLKVKYIDCRIMGRDTSGTGANRIMALNGDAMIEGRADLIFDVGFAPQDAKPELRYTMNSTSRNNFDSYTVNGHAYPKSDITTKASNGKYAFEHMDDVDKATMTVDETVEVTGKIGDEEINQVIKYKSTTKLH